MDYSAANAGLWNFIVQVGLLAGAILLAHFLYRSIKPIRKTMLPVAVLAGFGVFGKVVCSFLMLFGRLELLPMFILFTRSAWHKY